MFACSSNKYYVFVLVLTRFDTIETMLRLHLCSIVYSFLSLLYVSCGAISVTVVSQSNLNGIIVLCFFFVFLKVKIVMLSAAI